MVKDPPADAGDKGPSGSRPEAPGPGAWGPWPPYLPNFGPACRRRAFTVFTPPSPPRPALPSGLSAELACLTPALTLLLRASISRLAPSLGASSVLCVGPGPGWVWSALHLALMARLDSMVVSSGQSLCIAQAASLLRTHCPPPPDPWALSTLASVTARARVPGQGALQCYYVCLAARFSHQQHKEPICAGQPPPPPPPAAPGHPPPKCLATGLTVLARGPISAQRVFCLAGRA